MTQQLEKKGTQLFNAIDVPIWDYITTEPEKKLWMVSLPHVLEGLDAWNKTVKSGLGVVHAAKSPEGSDVRRILKERGSIQAWEEADIPFLAKLGIEIAADPTTWVGPIGMFGKANLLAKIPIAGKVLGPLEKGGVHLFQTLPEKGVTKLIENLPKLNIPGIGKPFGPSKMSDRNLFEDELRYIFRTFNVKGIDAETVTSVMDDVTGTVPLGTPHTRAISDQQARYLLKLPEHEFDFLKKHWAVVDPNVVNVTQGKLPKLLPHSIRVGVNRKNPFDNPVKTAEFLTKNYENYLGVHFEPLNPAVKQLNDFYTAWKEFVLATPRYIAENVGDFTLVAALLGDPISIRNYHSKIKPRLAEIYDVVPSERIGYQMPFEHHKAASANIHPALRALTGGVMFGAGGAYASENDPLAVTASAALGAGLGLAQPKYVKLFSDLAKRSERWGRRSSVASGIEKFMEKNLDDFLNSSMKTDMIDGAITNLKNLKGSPIKNAADEQKYRNIITNIFDEAANAVRKSEGFINPERLHKIVQDAENKVLGKFAGKTGLGPTAEVNWRDFLGRGINEGIDLSHKIHFPYRYPTNFIQFMKDPFGIPFLGMPFATFPLRNFERYARAFSRHPWLLRAWLDKYLGVSEQEREERGLKRRNYGHIPIFGGGGTGGQILQEITGTPGELWGNVARPMSIASQIRGARTPRPDDTWFESIYEPLETTAGISLSPLAQALTYVTDMQGFGDYGDIVPQSRLFRYLWPAASQELTKATGIPIGLQRFEPERLVKDFLRGTRSRLTGDPEPATVFDVDRQRALADLAFEKHGKRWTELPEYRAAMRDFHNPLNREAQQRVFREKAPLNLARYLIPLELSYLSRPDLDYYEQRKNVPEPVFDERGEIVRTQEWADQFKELSEQFPAAFSREGIYDRPEITNLRGLVSAYFNFKGTENEQKVLNFIENNTEDMEYEERRIWINKNLSPEQKRLYGSYLDKKRAFREYFPELNAYLSWAENRMGRLTENTLPDDYTPFPNVREFVSEVGIPSIGLPNADIIEVGKTAKGTTASASSTNRNAAINMTPNQLKQKLLKQYQLFGKLNSDARLNSDAIKLARDYILEKPSYNNIEIWLLDWAKRNPDYIFD